MMPIRKRLHQNTSGFTLIELLIVILVIGVLSGVLLSVVNSTGVRAKARDSQRKADLIKMQTALELYFADNRVYPISNITTPGSWERANSASSALTAALEPDYLDPVPEDPIQAGNNGGPCNNPDFYRYNYYSAAGNSYDLTAIMEISTSNDDSPCPGDITGCGGAGYATEDVCYYVRNP